MIIVDAHEDIAYNALCYGRDYRRSALETRLIGAAGAARAPLAYAMAGGQRHAACMALRPSLLPDLRAYLLAGDRKVGLWQARVGGVAAYFDDAQDAFMNVNTPEELAAAERYVGFAS